MESAGTPFRVVSMPCQEAFLRQDKAYREKVLPESARKVSIEAGVTSGWARLIGTDGLALGIDHFGASAPGEELAEKFGFSPEAVSEKIKAWL
jgi:transketolase